MGTFLEGYQWAHFHTLTFRLESGGEEFVRGAARRYLHRVHLAAGAPLDWFYGLEHGERFGRLHIHALTGNTERLPRGTMAAEWRLGYSRILDYDPTRGASYYVAKYVSKELADWDFSPNPELTAQVRAYRAPTIATAKRLANRDRTRAIARASLVRHHTAAPAPDFLAPSLPLTD